MINQLHIQKVKLIHTKQLKVFEVSLLILLKYFIVLSFILIDFIATEDEITYSKHTSLIVKVSIAIFLIYFGVLREPNDIDEILGADLFDVMPELEIPMLENEVKRLEAHGINADELRKKLDSLKQLASAKTN